MTHSDAQKGGIYMPHKEEWGVVNYGQRGPRGRMGISVKKMYMDSEGNV